MLCLSRVLYTMVSTATPSSPCYIVQSCHTDRQQTVVMMAFLQSDEMRFLDPEGSQSATTVVVVVVVVFVVTFRKMPKALLVCNG